MALILKGRAQYMKIPSYFQVSVNTKRPKLVLYIERKEGNWV